MDPLFVSVAAALAGKAAGNLYDIVRKRLKGDPNAAKQLEVVTSGQATPTDLDDLARTLEYIAQRDDGFRTALNAEVSRHVESSANGEDSVTNTVGGDVSGKVVQARDVEGGVHF